MNALNLHKTYKETIVPQLQSELECKSVMQVPGLVKVVVNMGVGEASQDSKLVNAAIDDLTRIAGQKPVVTRAKKSIAGFKLRENQPVGCKVTLRGERMYDFMTRLVNIALPRVRDFRGLSARGFDGNGNFTFGLKEQIVFPEIDYDKIDKIRGMDITIVTTARDNDSAKKLLKALNMPFYN